MCDGKNTRLAAVAWSSIDRASAALVAIGFSQNTCSPCSNAACAIAAWSHGGVAMSTKSSCRASAVKQRLGVGVDPGMRENLTRLLPAGSAYIGHRDDLDLVGGGEIGRDMALLGNESEPDEGTL